MLWINPIRRLNKNDLNFQFEKIKVPFCDELIKFITDNHSLYPDQNTKAVNDYRQLLVDHIEGLERDFEVLENIKQHVFDKNLEVRKGVAKLENTDYSLHFLDDEYTLIFFTGFDEKSNAYKYGLITFKIGKKRNSILDAEIIFNSDPIRLEYTICDYFNNLFSLMNSASTIDQLNEIQDDIEKQILKIFRASSKHDLFEKKDDFNNFYGIEPFTFLRDKHQFYIRNKVKLELINKEFPNFNEDHIELVRVDRILKSLLDTRKEQIELMGEEIYTSRCDELTQEKNDLIIKLDLEERLLNLLLS